MQWKLLPEKFQSFLEMESFEKVLQTITDRQKMKGVE